MGTMLTARCDDCAEEYGTTSTVHRGLCPRCQRLEDQRFANDTTPDIDMPWKYSRRAMKERLGVTGNEDV